MRLYKVKVTEEENLSFEKTLKLKYEVASKYKEEMDLVEFSDIPCKMRFQEFSEWADELGVSVSRQTLFYYIREGLLPEPIKKDGKVNQAYYSHDHFFGFLIINLLKMVYSLDTIKIFLTALKGDYKKADNKEIWIILYNNKLLSDKINREIIEKVSQMSEVNGLTTDQLIIDLLLRLLANGLSINQLIQERICGTYAE